MSTIMELGMTQQFPPPPPTHKELAEDDDALVLAYL